MWCYRPLGLGLSAAVVDAASTNAAEAGSSTVAQCSAIHADRRSPPTSLQRTETRHECEYCGAGWVRGYGMVTPRCGGHTMHYASECGVCDDRRVRVNTAVLTGRMGVVTPRCCEHTMHYAGQVVGERVSECARGRGAAV